MSRRSRVSPSSTPSASPFPTPECSATANSSSSNPTGGSTPSTSTRPFCRTGRVTRLRRIGSRSAIVRAPSSKRRYQSRARSRSSTFSIRRPAPGASLSAHGMHGHHRSRDGHSPWSAASPPAAHTTPTRSHVRAKPHWRRSDRKPTANRSTGDAFACRSRCPTSRRRSLRKTGQGGPQHWEPAACDWAARSPDALGLSIIPQIDPAR